MQSSTTFDNYEISQWLFQDFHSCPELWLLVDFFVEALSEIGLIVGQCRWIFWRLVKSMWGNPYSTPPLDICQNPGVSVFATYTMKSVYHWVTVKKKSSWQFSLWGNEDYFFLIFQNSVAKMRILHKVPYLNFSLFSFCRVALIELSDRKNGFANQENHLIEWDMQWNHLQG